MWGGKGDGEVDKVVSWYELSHRPLQGSHLLIPRYRIGGASGRGRSQQQREGYCARHGSVSEWML